METANQLHLLPQMHPYDYKANSCHDTEFICPQVKRRELFQKKKNLIIYLEKAEVAVVSLRLCIIKLGLWWCWKSGEGLT